MKNTLHLAIVDDDQHYADLTALRLTKHIPHGEITGTWNNAANFISHLRTSAKLPDVVLMDIQMSGMSGIEATLHMQEHFTSVKVVAFTQWDNPERVARMLMCGAKGFIGKTLPVETQSSILHNIHLNTHAWHEHPLAEAVLQKWHFMQQSCPALSVKLEQTLLCLCKGMTREQIADYFGLSKESVKKYIQELYLLTNTHTSADLMRYAFRNGYVL